MRAEHRWDVSDDMIGFTLTGRQFSQWLCLSLDKKQYTKDIFMQSDKRLTAVFAGYSSQAGKQSDKKRMDG